MEDKEKIYKEYICVSEKFFKKVDEDFEKLIKENIKSIKNCFNSLDFLLDQQVSQIMVLYLINVSLYRLYSSLIWEGKLGTDYKLDVGVSWNTIIDRILEMKKLLKQNNIISYIYKNLKDEPEMVCLIYDTTEKYIKDVIENNLKEGEKNSKV